MRVSSSHSESTRSLRMRRVAARHLPLRPALPSLPPSHPARSRRTLQFAMSTASPVKFTIDVVSDNICPWCFVGKRRMEQALRELGAPVAVRWLPFFLNPHTPPEGYDLRQYLAEKYGAARAAAFDPGNPQNPLNLSGAEVGIRFNSARRVVNTLNSHRLVKFAETHNQVIEALFCAYFEEARDIASADVLTSIATACGLDTEKVRHYLASSEDRDEVLSEAQRWSARINGVPFFIIGAPGVRQRVTLNGAQPKETFLDAFTHLGTLPANKV